MARAESARVSELVRASFDALDRAVAAPARLRKGPRGGGRDRDAIFAHVAEAESAYARKLGLRVVVPDPVDRAAVAAARRQILVALMAAGRRAGAGMTGGWPPRYAARRFAWHALDHAWEIEDRSAPAAT